MQTAFHQFTLVRYQGVGNEEDEQAGITFRNSRHRSVIRDIETKIVTLVVPVAKDFFWCRSSSRTDRGKSVSSTK